ncbi:MAG: hypothetical protein OEM82_08265 [Acidobacteriota bacterium]|nr:hypothetical protein [Acidobacteriota bacterium]
MLRKPNYCCNCGDKVERLEWHVWNSSRFCELCETEYLFDEWLPRVALAVVLVIGLTGIGFHYKGDEKPVVIGEANVPVFEKKRETAKPDPGAASAHETTNTAEPAVVPRTSGETRVTEPETRPPANPITTVGEAEEISFCGAPTKKGTPCARRVRGGGRCWQHKDSKSPVQSDRDRYNK